MTTAEAHKNSGMGKDLVVYLCILALAGIQFVIAYLCAAGDAIWMDRQLPAVERRTVGDVTWDGLVSSETKQT